MKTSRLQMSKLKLLDNPETFGLQELEHFDQSSIYIGRRFNEQRSTRFVFYIPRIGKTVEASNYEHLKDGKPVKMATEVSCMFGCPVGCIYCASGGLGKPVRLTAEEITGQQLLLLGYYLSSNKNPADELHVAFQGIGEPTLMPRQILDSIRNSLNKYSTLKYKLSTVMARPKRLLDFAESWVPWEAVQFTLPHYDENWLRKFFEGMPNYSLDETMRGIVEFHNRRPDIRMKVNYIGIDGFNSRDEDIANMARLLRKYRLDNEVELKFSYLNPTCMTEKKSLRPIPYARLKEMRNFAEGIGVKSYVFGPMKDILVGCGQLIKKRRD